MEEVDGERMLAEPEEVLGGEAVFELGREENSQANKIHSNPRKKPRQVLTEAAEILAEILEVGTPRGPGYVGFGVGGEPESNEHEYRGEETTDPGAGVEPVEGGLVVGEVGEEGAEEELHVECYWKMS